MKNLKSVIIILLFASASVIERANAQAKPIYFIGNKIVSSPINAEAYGVYGKLSDQEIWILKRYDLDDNLMMSGSFKDDQLAIPHGEFVYYKALYIDNDEGEVQRIKHYVGSKGKFIDGFKEGTWFSYFANGKVASSENYVGGKLDGSYKSYDIYGKIQFIGEFKDDLKTGIWFDIKKRLKQVYDDDKLVNTVKLTRDQVKELQ